MWGRGRWGERKEKRFGSCVCGGRKEGGGGVKEERLGSYVYVGGRGRLGERREVLHMILLRVGGWGGSTYFGKVGVFAWRVAI